MKQVLFTRKWPGNAVALLQEAGLDVVERPDFNAPTEDELISMVRKGPMAIVTTVEDPVTASVIDEADPSLKIVAQAGVGYDNVNVAAAARRGIWTSNTPGVLDEATADLAFALLCSIARRIPQSDRYVREGSWTCWHPSLFLGPELYRATVGIVGFGRIGKAFARRCTGFDMNILYTAKSEKETAIPSARWVPLEELLSESDFVSVHVPLSPSTDRMLNAARLGLMKPGALLINTARGRVVDTPALIDALVHGDLGGAALDVTDPEPLPPDHPLLALDNVIVTPHIGSASTKARTRMAETAARNVIAVAGGNRPPNAVRDVETQ